VTSSIMTHALIDYIDTLGMVFHNFLHILNTFFAPIYYVFDMINSFS
jgi:hypothetical protein